MNAQTQVAFSQEQALANVQANVGAFHERGINLIAAIVVARIRTWYLATEEETGTKGRSVADTDELIAKALGQHGSKKSKIYYCLGLAKKWTSKLIVGGKDKSAAIQAVLTAVDEKHEDNTTTSAAAAATRDIVALAKADGITTLDLLNRKVNKPKAKKGKAGDNQVRPTTATPEAVAARLESEPTPSNESDSKTMAVAIGAKPFVSNYKRGGGDMVMLIVEGISKLTSLEDCERIAKALKAHVNSLSESVKPAKALRDGAEVIAA